MYDTVRSFVKMTDVRKSNLLRKELHHFPCLTSLPNIFVTNLNKYTGLLEKLNIEFVVKRFSDFKSMENDFSFFANPLAIDLHKVKPEMQQEFADLQCARDIQMQCKELIDFDIFKQLNANKFPSLGTFAITVAAMFGSTYRPICEQFFS